MNRLPRFRAAVMAGWLCASALGVAADSPAGGTNTIVEQAWVRAVEAGDREVLAAVEYNRRHLDAVSTDEAIAQAALDALVAAGQLTEHASDPGAIRARAGAHAARAIATPADAASSKP